MRILSTVGGSGLVASAALTMLTGWSAHSLQPTVPAGQLWSSGAPNDQNQVSQSVTFANGPRPQRTITSAPPMRTRSFLSPGAKGEPLIFVADAYATVNIYLQAPKHRLVGWITGLSVPTGLATDAAADLYITISGGFSGTPAVMVFAPPYTKAPILMLQTGPSPFGVSVSPQGTVAVTGCTLSGSSCANSITFYAKGSGVPCAEVLTSAAFTPGYVAFDQKGNLYISGYNASGGGAVGEIDGGCDAKGMVLLATNNTIGVPGGLQIDKAGRIAVLDSSPNAVIDTYLHPKNGSLGSPVSTTPLTSSSAANTFTFLASGHGIWVADANGRVSNYHYPTGGVAEQTIIGGGFPYGIAVTPPLLP